MMDADQRRDFEERLTFLEDDREKADGRITALELQVFRLTRQLQEQQSLLQRLMQGQDPGTTRGMNIPEESREKPASMVPMTTSSNIHPDGRKEQ